MLAFLVVTALVIAFVLGSALAMRPSPRQRQLASLRARALGEGLRVRLRPGEREVDYLLPWRSLDAVIASQITVDAERGEGDEWRITAQGMAVTAPLSNALATFPLHIRRVLAHPEGVSARWGESGSVEEVVDIARSLRALRDACASRA
jgi:hypothetical protein